MADIKRLNYFNSEFLVDQDFKDEQAYHLGMRRRHNSVLHTWGVADGLLVTKAADKAVAISAGTALDDNGQEIVLLDSQQVDLSSFAANDDVYVTLAYQELELEADHYKSGGVDDYKRTTERPLIASTKATPPSDGSVIGVAKVHLDGSGNVATIDQSIRRSSGAVLPSGSDLVVNSLALMIAALPSSQWPRLSATVANRVDVTGWLSVAGGVSVMGISTVAGSLTVGGSASVAGSLGVGAAPAAQRVLVSGADATPNGFGAALGLANTAAGGARWYLRAGATGTVTPAAGFSIADDIAYRLTINNAGNVGVGTTAPLSRLHSFATGGFGGEDANGLSLASNVPLLAHSNGTAIGILNAQGRQCFALNIDANPGTATARGIPTFYDKYDGTWHSCLAFKNGSVGIGTAAPDRSLTIANTVGANYMNVKDGTREILMGVDGTGGIVSVMTNHDLVLRTGGNSEKVRITAGGDTAFTGRLGVLGQPPAPRTPGWGGGIHTFDLEAEGTVWSRNGYQSGARDIAENYEAETDLEAGDVVCLDIRKKNRIVRSESPNDPLVLGVVSTAPGFLLHVDPDGKHQDAKHFPVALCGRVPCNVTDEGGPIERGDLLTSSSTPGHAMKAERTAIGGAGGSYRPGTIIGKALAPLNSGNGVIEIFVLFM